VRKDQDKTLGIIFELGPKTLDEIENYAMKSNELEFKKYNFSDRIFVLIDLAKKLLKACS